MGSRTKKKKVLVVFGTRPEALKLAPVIKAGMSHKGFKIVTCLTGQHRQMVDQVVRLFKMPIHYDLDVMLPSQSLGTLTQRILPPMEKIFLKEKPDLVLVQGDTTTAFVVSLQAFYQGVAVGHVEAGLRTGNKQQPFPEEMNRVLISQIADHHFAPTQNSKQNLIREGAQKKSVVVTGNTVVDALKWVSPLLASIAPTVLKKVNPSHRMILMTAHRRESFGAPMVRICKAVKDILKKFEDVEVVYPVHLNPNVQKVVKKELSGVKRVHLIKPVDYFEFLSLMQKSTLVLSDSGGVQEEAPSFKKPVLVMREVSERGEGIDAGIAKLVGTSREKIVKEVSKLLSSSTQYKRMVAKKNPYGDGKASQRILNAI